MTKEEEEKIRQIKVREKSLKDRWSFFYKNERLKIEEQIAGSLPHDSGDYLRLRSFPEIEYLNNKIFGDWFLIQFDGIFLQRWNNERRIICDLVFIDFEGLNVSIIKTGIPTKVWKTEKVSESEVKFSFLSENEEVIYLVRQTELLRTE